MAEILVSTQKSASGLSQGNATPMTIGSGQYFFMIMLYSGTPGTLYFDGRNVMDFLNCFFNLCADYKLSDKKKMRWFS